MNQFLKRAKELESQLQADRRYLHQHAEAGENLPNTTKYVMELSQRENPWQTGQPLRFPSAQIGRASCRERV